MTQKRVLIVDDSTTIRKVVTGILERHGYEAVAAADAQIALDALRGGGAKFDLVLVDFVMPRMNGFQFCRELRKIPLGHTVPVVLMSAKSDKIREKFVLQTGAVDAISKPFDAQALVTLIEHALDRIARGKVPELRQLDGVPSSAGAPSSGSGGASSEHPSQPPAEDTQSTTVIAFTGNLGGIPIGAVMQLLQMEAMSGIFTVKTDGSEVRMVMRKGLIDRVESRGARDEFRLGRFFVEAGLVTPLEIEALLAGPTDTTPAATRGPRLGDVLLRSGKVSEPQLRDALTRQASELVYDVLRWERGTFELGTIVTDEDKSEPRLGLSVASVVMEGFRRVDEWRLIEAKLGNFDEVLVPDPVALASLGKGVMTKHERAVLDAIDSVRTVREVVRASHMSSFDACKIVSQFLEARLVRRRAA